MDYVAVDIGATNLRLALGEDDEGLDEDKKEKMASDPLYVEEEGEFVDELRYIIESFLQGEGYEMEDIDSIGVAAPGPVDMEEGTFDPFFYDGVSGVDLSGLLEEGDVYMHNDVKVAAIGEHVYGDHGTDSLVYVTMSSGIGGAFIDNGRLGSGWNGNVAEIGHFTVDHDSGVSCGCGGKGHWHALCGGEGLPRMAEELGEEFEDAEEIFSRLEQGDEGAEKVVKRFQEYNRRAVEEILNAYNPEVIVFGGAVALNNKELVLEDLRENVDAINATPEITSADLGDDAGLHGARAMCEGDYQIEPL